ncbi:putative gustatory receptor 28b [Toxorhynchites rutilus septentrionalis]|uniref:putative gustatory receptor 28b n=1 Tax=Toxorhynchites rutilus septentrionalis TaxID=329112 RepID=UPI002478B6A9|nr:putative gustatory receptor 28b [Toxorhynchites rutilus septentrionalis]
MAKLTSKVTDSSSSTGDSYLIVKPVYYMAKLVGLWPQTLRRSSPGFTVRWIIYLMVEYSFIGYCIYVNSSVPLWRQYMSKIGSGILLYGLQIHIIHGLIMAIVMSICNLIQHKNKWSFLELNEEVAAILARDFYVNFPFNTRKLLLYGVVVGQNALLLTVILGYYYILAFQLKIKTKLLYVSYYIVNMTSLIFTIEYVSLVFAVKARLVTINRLLKQFITAKKNLTMNIDAKIPTIAYDEIFTIYNKPKEDSNRIKDIRQNKFSFKYHTKIFRKLKFSNLFSFDDIVINQNKINYNSSSMKIIKFIEKLSGLHYKTCQAIQLLNRIYSFQLMLQFGAMFLFLVFGLFALYKAFNVNSAPFKLMATANGFWIIYYLLTILMIINTMSSTVDTCYETGDIVHQIIRCKQNTFSNEVIEKLSMFSLQLKMRDVSFSCGLFRFDWPLFASILAAIVMYLVFLIQFDVSPIQDVAQGTIEEQQG